MNLPDYKFEQFPDFAVLKQTLDSLVEAVPDLVKVEIIGHSREGREIFLTTLSDFSTGSPEERPAIYVQSDIHALEIGRTHLLYAIRELLEFHEKTGILSRKTFYIIPSINPDHVENVIRYGMPFLRSSMEFHSDLPNVLCPADVDGDGKILWMRRKCTDGKFAPDPEDPRLMIPRTPDMQGPFYEILPEGFIENWSGDAEFSVMTSRNWNRAFPSKWLPDHPSCGAYPMNEPELRVVGDFLASKPNICGAVSLHVGGDCVVAPPNRAKLTPGDSALMKRIGKEGCEAMKTPYVLSCELQVPPWVWEWPSADRPGTFVDYCYEQYGMPSYDLELSGLYASVGVRFDDIASLRNYDEFNELQRKTMAFYDLQKDVPPLFEPWRIFEHPQLGEVELGGLYHHVLYARLISEIPQEGAQLADFLVRFAKFTPQAELEELEIIQLPGERIYEVRIRPVNSGQRPTQLTDQGSSLWWKSPLRIEFHPADGVKIISAFRAKTLAEINAFGKAPVVCWTIQLSGDSAELGTIEFNARTGGKTRKTVRLK